MARYTGAIVKKSRRFGQDLGHKQNLQKVARRISVLPGQHGRKGSRRASEYGLQLAEKQKLQFAYGILESQLRRYVSEAQRNPQATGEELIRLIERRLDNVVYRLGFAPTRPMARQLVSHGHVLVNNHKVNIPSFRVAVDDVISLTNRTLEIPDVRGKIQDKEYQVPGWMQKKATAGKISRLPERIDIEVPVDEQLVVEFYSR